jgi:hypothetical protein
MRRKEMKKLQKLLLVTAWMMLSGLMTVNSFAQDLSGRWEGTFLWAGNAGMKDNVTYDWDEGKWLNTTRKPVNLAIELEKTDEDGKYTGTYFYHTGYDQMKFEAVFADSMLKGSAGKTMQGSGKWGGYMELTLREKDGKRYLEGSWRSYQSTQYWEGSVALRHVDGN